MKSMLIAALAAVSIAPGAVLADATDPVAPADAGTTQTAAPAETPAPAEAAAPAAEPAPAQASLAAFEVRGPVLAAGVPVQVRPGASLSTRPVAGADSVAAPSGTLTLGASVDNENGTWWYIRQDGRQLGWINQTDIATGP